MLTTFLLPHFSCKQTELCTTNGAPMSLIPHVNDLPSSQDPLEERGKFSDYVEPLHELLVAHHTGLVAVVVDEATLEHQGVPFADGREVGAPLHPRHFLKHCCKTQELENTIDLLS